MMSLETIQSMSRRAARDSRKAGLLPLVIEEEDMPLLERGELPGKIPFIGNRTPRGFRRTGDDLFCDISGWGSPDEPAMTQEQLVEEIRRRGPNHAYALVEAGQWQGYVRVFRVGKAREE